MGLFLKFLILFSLIFVLNCRVQSAENLKPCKFLLFAEAEQILGQSVKNIENKEYSTKNSKRFDCIYSAISENREKDFELRIYFSFEEFQNEMEAKNVYQSIWNSNKNHPGVESLKKLGDEAYFHTDNENFNFLIGRKGKSIIRFKVRRAINSTSVEKLKSISKKILEQV